jgi:GWxTD domain-containing protein
LLAKDGWLASRNLGRLSAAALAADACPQAPPAPRAPSRYAPVDRLIAWNYLCPEEFGGILDGSFESVERRGAADRAITMTSFRSAVEAYLAHAGANMEVLLGLAEERRWADLLAAARRFASVSEGDPHGLLFAGVALQRLSRSEEAEESFQAALLALPSDQARIVEDVAPLLLEPQASEYAALSPEQQARWRDAFWQPLDPILTTPVNERRVEHMARAAYALMRFTSTRSDPGEVWVRYGQPDEIRAFEEGPGVRTEFWDYGPGPDLTFRRLSGSDVPALTPEGRAYLDEVRQLVPHRYGQSARQVFSLQAQVSRFENPTGEGSVEMHTHVPMLFASGGSDSLDVSLLLLGEKGGTLSVTRARVPAMERDVSLRAAARGGVTGVVVEMYSPATGQAAALRRSVSPLSTASGATMSDVILTAPASAGKGDARRDAAWLEPLALDVPVQGEVIGAYFELYRGATTAPWYRLRAELEDRATGDLRDLPIQPAGENGFRPTWDRRPLQGSVTPEFVSVWLGGIPPGRYVVRLVADVADASARLSAEQALDRR